MRSTSTQDTSSNRALGGKYGVKTDYFIALGAASEDATPNLFCNVLRFNYFVFFDDVLLLCHKLLNNGLASILK